MTTDLVIPTLSNYVSGSANNNHVAKLGKVDLYFSYSTCIAFRTPKTGLVVCSNVWGKTTGKHLNSIDSGGKDAKAKRLDRATFEQRLTDALQEVFGS